MLRGNNLGFRAKLKSDEPAYLSPVTPIMTPGGLPPLRVGFMKLIFDQIQHLAWLICTDAIEGNVTSPSGIVLPHQQEIERISSFRDQLGEDWLRYQHHLDRASPDNLPCTQTPPLPNGGNATAVPSLSPNTLDVLPPPQHLSETAVDPCDEVEDQETESTLQWPGHSPPPTESTLEDSVLDSLPLSQSRPRAESKELANGDREDSKEDEEEDLGGKSLATFSFLKEKNVTVDMSFLRIGQF